MSYKIEMNEEEIEKDIENAVKRHEFGELKEVSEFISRVSETVKHSQG